MAKRRTRLALMGVLTLALALTVGLASGSVADAKKGKKKGGGKGNSVTIAKATPTILPPGVPAQPAGCGGFLPPFTPCTTSGRTSLTSVPLVVGKKAKGKVVSADSVSITFTITGSPRTGAGTASNVDAAASAVNICLTAPNQRTACVFNPAGAAGDPNATTIGPVTVTPDSANSVCPIMTTGPDGTQSVCGSSSGLTQLDPEDVVGPPTYTGTIGDNSLVDLGGVPARGTWTFKLRNLSGQTPATVSNVSARIGLAPAPGGGGGKK